MRKYGVWEQRTSFGRRGIGRKIVDSYGTRYSFFEVIGEDENSLRVRGDVTHKIYRFDKSSELMVEEQQHPLYWNAYGKCD